ncbi:hypothetical protein AGMMS49593_01050 [Endomicrobiia bacterium]|nr:hypothetical protein AGMMS49593_01050 [Endomicrobiia bacterium]
MIGIFGGGGSDQIFNAPSGMAFIKKLTIIMACMFLFTSLMLTKLSAHIGIMSVVNDISSTSLSTPAKQSASK